MDRDDDKNELLESAASLGFSILWKKAPMHVKLQVLGSLLVGAIHFILPVFVVLMIIFIPTMFSEEFYLLFTNGMEAITSFGDKAGELFVTDYETKKAEKAEKAYYKKLEDVYNEYLDKYGVAIDTTMITATLFYGRNMGDYIEDDEAASTEDSDLFDDNLFYEGDIGENAEDKAKFYKVAKGHIKTLAKYMLIQNTTFNACVEPEKAIKVIKPSTFKEIADNWSTVSTWQFNDQSMWNSINNFNYTTREDKSYTNAEGIQKTISWCHAEDARKQLYDGFKEDKTIYLEKQEKYNSCVARAKAACISSCPGCVDVNSPSCPYCEDCSLRDECKSGCNAANYDDVCATEKAEYDLASKYYHENWLDEGLFNHDTEELTCKTTTKWGHLQKYDDKKRYLNYKFDPSIIDHADKPNFLENYPFEMNEKIDCSDSAAISYTYEIDIAEEGVYYYKLLAKTTAGFFKSDKSFIERYYDEYIVKTNEETILESSKKIVDDIFLLYDTLVDREYKYCYTPGNTNTTGVSGGTSNVVSTTRSEFINSIANDAIRDMENTGILASVTIAQAILESGNGGSKLSKTYNNYYGMTAGSCAPDRPNSTASKVVKPGQDGNECSGNAYWDGTVVWMCNGQGKDCQWYRVYDSFIKSTHDHSRLLSTSHYSCQGIFDPNQALACIQAGGYATDPQYISKVMNIIDGNNLTQFDIGEWNGEIITDYSGNGLGTICFTSAFDRDLALGNEISNGEGTIDGFIGNVRTQLYGTPEYMTYWGSNNNIFHASGYDKECTWYANGRGMEILVNNGMSLSQAKEYMRPMHGNAGRWFGQNKYFSSSVNVNAPKVGAIIVWSNGSKPGHVAIIENIHYDAAGNPVSVDISHGGQSLNGFSFNANKSLDWVASHSTYRFIGYVYLLG